MTRCFDKGWRSVSLNFLLRYSVCFLITMSANSEIEDTPFRRSYTSDGWRLSVRTDHRNYPKGAKVKVVTTLTNEAQIRQFIALGDFLGSFNVTVRRRGEDLPISTEQRMGAINGGRKGKMFSTGEGITFSVVLPDILEEGKRLPPGEYTIDVRKDFRDRFTLDEVPLVEGENLLVATTQFSVSSK